VIKKFITSTIFLVVHAATYSAGLNAEQQVNLYDRCKPSCVKGFDGTKLGSTLKNKPFFIDAYCSCYCTRIASRLSQSGVAQMMSDGMTNGNMFNGELKELAMQAGELCMTPLVEP
jgi:K+-transporting ATPase c subunit